MPATTMPAIMITTTSRGQASSHRRLKLHLVMPANAVLHGGAHRLALGVEFHVLGVFLGHWNQSLVLIELGGLFMSGSIQTFFSNRIF
jgi:hypothetical protein